MQNDYITEFENVYPCLFDMTHRVSCTLLPVHVPFAREIPIKKEKKTAHGGGEKGAEGGEKGRGGVLIGG